LILWLFAADLPIKLKKTGLSASAMNFLLKLTRFDPAETN